jgi:hypothetical protein
MPARAIAPHTSIRAEPSAGRRFDAVIDFAAFTGDDARGAI